MEEKEIKDKKKRFYGREERRLARTKPTVEIPLELRKQKCTIDDKEE